MKIASVVLVSFFHYSQYLHQLPHGHVLQSFKVYSNKLAKPLKVKISNKQNPERKIFK